MTSGLYYVVAFTFCLYITTTYLPSVCRVGRFQSPSAEEGTIPEIIKDRKCLRCVWNQKYEQYLVPAGISAFAQTPRPPVPSAKDNDDSLASLSSICGGGRFSFSRKFLVKAFGERERRKKKPYYFRMSRRACVSTHLVRHSGHG